MYCGELTALKLSLLRTLLEIFKTGQELLSTKSVLDTRLEEVKSHGRDTQAAHEVADVKLAMMSHDEDEVVELRKR